MRSIFAIIEASPIRYLQSFYGHSLLQAQCIYLIRTPTCCIYGYGHSSLYSCMYLWVYLTLTVPRHFVRFLPNGLLWVLSTHLTRSSSVSMSLAWQSGLWVYIQDTPLLSCIRLWLFITSFGFQR